MSELLRLEKEIDTIQHAMDTAYDLGNMKEWRRLKNELDRVGKQYRALLAELNQF